MAGQLSAFQPLSEFEERLPLNPYCGNSKRSEGIMSRDEARDYRYIQINFPAIHYLAFDCDSHDAAIRPAEMGLPAPTLSVLAPGTGRGHLFYQFMDPLPRKGKSRKTSDLLRDVASGLMTMLEADRCIVGEKLLVKNALCSEWDVIEGYAPFSLAELIEYVPDRVKQESKSHIPDRRRGIELLSETREKMALQNVTTPDSRNCSIFHNARIYAYSIADQHASYESLLRVVLEYVEALNHQQVPDSFPGKGKILDPAELRTIARSISRYTFANRAHFSNGHRGIMELQPLGELGLEGKEYDAEVRRRNRLSAERTHRIRRERTRARVEEAVYLCRKRGFDVTPDNISTLSRLSRRTIYNYMEMVRELTQAER